MQILFLSDVNIPFGYFFYPKRFILSGEKNDSRVPCSTAICAAKSRCILHFNIPFSEYKIQISNKRIWSPNSIQNPAGCIVHAAFIRFYWMRVSLLWWEQGYWGNAAIYIHVITYHKTAITSLWHVASAILYHGAGFLICLLLAILTEHTGKTRLTMCALILTIYSQYHFSFFRQLFPLSLIRGRNRRLFLPRSLLRRFYASIPALPTRIATGHWGCFLS